MGKSYLTAAIVGALGAMGKRVALTGSTGVAGVQARTCLRPSSKPKPRSHGRKRIARPPAPASPASRRVLAFHHVKEAAGSCIPQKAGLPKRVLRQAAMREYKDLGIRDIRVPSLCHVRVCSQIGGCTLHSFAGIGKGDESRDALARAAVKSEKVCQGFQAHRVLNNIRHKPLF